VVLAFIEAEDEFAAIAQRLADDAAAIHGELQRLDESLGESIELTLPPS
jgi:putative two-component system response regulator